MARGGREGNNGVKRLAEELEDLTYEKLWDSCEAAELESAGGNVKSVSGL